MSGYGIQQKFNTLMQKPEYKGLPVQSAMSQMLKDGVLTQAEYDQLMNTSAFGFGFEVDFTDGFVRSNTPSVPIPLRSEEEPQQQTVAYTNAQYNEAMDFAKQYLMDSSASVHNALINYSNSVGRVSFGSVWHIMKNIADLFTDRAFRTNNIKTHAEAMEEARKAEFEAKRLSGFSAGLPFETEYKKSRGIEFDVAKVENFKTKSEEYMFVKACKNQYDLLNDGIKELQGLYTQEKQLERMQSSAMAQTYNPDGTVVRKFDAKLIELLDQYCGGDENLRNQLILEISGDIKSKDELDKRFLEVLTKLRDNAKTVLDSQLNGKDFDKYHEEYTKAYAETFGGEDAQEAVNGWIAKQEAGTQFLKMSAIIAATILTGGSALAANSSASLASALGSKFAAQQIVKLAITLEGVGVGVGAEYLNALTSKTGLTAERNEQILQGAKHSLPYALFGAFVSGPLGDKVTNALLGNASPALSGIVKTAFEKSTTGVGFVTEVGLDVLFESALGDGDFVEIIKGNVNGELQGRALNKLMSMVMGGRAHYASKTAIEGAENSVTQALKNMGLEGYKAKMNDDGSFQIKSPDGETYNTSVEDFAKIFATLADNAVKIEEQKVEATEEQKVEVPKIEEQRKIDKQIDEFKLMINQFDITAKEKEKYIKTFKELKSINNNLSNDTILKIIDFIKPKQSQDFINKHIEEQKNLNTVKKLLAENSITDDILTHILPNNNIEDINKILNNYKILSQYDLDNLTKYTLSNFDNLTPKLIEEYKILINEVKNLINITPENCIDFKYIENTNIDELSNYLSRINKEGLKAIAPKIMNYSPTEIINFVNHHMKNGVEVFTKETLSFTNNPTEYFSKKPITSTELKDIFTKYPLTQRNIGDVPKEWSTNPKINEEITRLFEKFVIEMKRDFMTEEIENENVIIDKFKANLEKFIGKKVSVEELGSGSYGFCYKVSVDGATPVVLKMFYTDKGMFDSGCDSEIQLASFLNSNFKGQTAEFYFGKVYGRENDAFMVTEFIDKNLDYSSRSKKQSKNWTYLHKDNKNDNTINGIIVDFGCIEVRTKNLAEQVANGQKVEEQKVDDYEVQGVKPFDADADFEKKYKAVERFHSIIEKYDYKMSDGDAFLAELDFENAEVHLDNFEKLLSIDPDLIMSAMWQNLFSSKEAAEGLSYILSITDNVKGLSVVFSSYNLLKDMLMAKELGLTDVHDVVNASGIGKDAFIRLQNSKYKGTLEYVSTNEKINEIFLSYMQYEKGRTLAYYDKIILEDINNNPKNESKIIDFYKELFNNFNSSLDLNQVFVQKGALDAYKKAYEYKLQAGVPEDYKMLVIDENNPKFFMDAVNGQDVMFFDKNGNYIRTESIKNGEGKVVENVQTDIRAISLDVDYKSDGNNFELLQSAKEIRNAEGKLLYTEKYEVSKDIPNKYDIIREYPDGSVDKIGLAEVSPSGYLVIEKTLVSETGVKTDYNYTEAPDGSRLSYSRITNSEGKVVLENKYKYKVVDDNHFKTTENGVEYDIQYTDTEVIVTKNNGETVSIKIGENSIDTQEVFSKELLPLLKRMPGSFYFAIDKYGLKKIGLEAKDFIFGSIKDNAYFKPNEKIINISQGRKDFDFTLAHEFGHYLDHALNIRSNPEVIEIYTRERSKLISEQPGFEAMKLDYFIDGNSLDKSIGEMVAEVNAFLFFSNTAQDIEMRGQYLQQHFPETFAKIADILIKGTKTEVEIPSKESVGVSHIIPDDYRARVGRVRVSTNGGLSSQEVQLHSNFRRAMNKVLVATGGSHDLPDEVRFQEFPEKPDGLACHKSGVVSINRTFIEHLDDSIEDLIKKLVDVGSLMIDKNGRYRIAAHLRNPETIAFERKLNGYDSSMQMADKFTLYGEFGYFVNLQNQARKNPMVTIRTIMRHGDNQSKLKHLGLLKMPEEVSKMSIEQQFAYLQEITQYVAIPEYAVPKRDVDHLYIHEIGHLNHRLTLEQEAELNSSSVINNHKNDPKIQDTCSKVSNYAKQEPKEFVAEVYAGLINGHKFDDDVMELYERYYGPKI